MASPGRIAPPAAIKLGITLPNRVQAGQVGGAPLSAFGTPGRASPPRPVLLNPGPALPRQQTGDRQTNALQEGIRSSTAQAKGHPLAAANLIENVSFSGAGTRLIAHGLGHAFRSALICGGSASGVTIQRPSGILQDAQAVAVTVTGAVAFDLLVW